MSTILLSGFVAIYELSPIDRFTKVELGRDAFFALPEF